jgi:hypothetical protein
MGGPAAYDLGGLTRPPDRARELHHVAEPTEPGRLPDDGTAAALRAGGLVEAGRGGPAAVPLTLQDSARRAGHYTWAERRLFEVLGSWIGGVAEPAVKVHLSAHSRHHAWHADLWHDRLPALHDLDPERLVVAANDELVAFMAAMAEPDAPDPTVERLVGVYRVLIPHLVVAYTRHLGAASAVTDGPTIRVLKLVLNDEMEAWRDGELLIQSLVDSPAAVDRATGHAARLHKMLLAAGGVAGPGGPGPRSGDGGPGTR